MKTYKTFKLGNIKTSNLELIDITKSWIVLSLAFTFIFTAINAFDGGFVKILTPSFWIVFVVSLFTAGLGFLLHEMAHKITAQKYGCAAEFRAFDQMLYLALVLAILVGFLFAAPGAVIITGSITRKENGIISIAGPATNYILSLIFLGLGFLLPPLKFAFMIGFSVNLWLGLFNMIPFLNFDGKKIFDWNKLAWIGMVAFGILFLFLPAYL